MEYVVKDLEEIRNTVRNRTQTIDKKRMAKDTHSSIVIKIVEDALSKVYCKYMLEIANSIVCNKPIDKSLHVSLTRTLKLFEKTKEEISKTMGKTNRDPIKAEHMQSVIDKLQYSTT
ncbi:hypothetical protein NEMIN01_0519 [Nematocida minor]|uniref:uncharacterized protein n=1 Tax=Nematocida minor TaxID=1912983 RepID=UPI00221F547C|nr:uncharacterized protein NEMIN01_0519 [Nematocida minor]KAI5189456.1 hypothetical protein NEMIN01_0519 [Nematocida minor]